MGFIKLIQAENDEFMQRNNMESSTALLDSSGIICNVSKTAPNFCAIGNPIVPILSELSDLITRYTKAGTVCYFKNEEETSEGLSSSQSDLLLVEKIFSKIIPITSIVDSNHQSTFNPDTEEFNTIGETGLKEIEYRLKVDPIVFHHAQRIFYKIEILHFDQLTLDIGQRSLKEHEYIKSLDNMKSIQRNSLSKKSHIFNTAIDQFQIHLESTLKEKEKVNHNGIFQKTQNMLVFSRNIQSKHSNQINEIKGDHLNLIQRLPSPSLPRRFSRGYKEKNLEGENVDSSKEIEIEPRDGVTKSHFMESKKPALFGKEKLNMISNPKYQSIGNIKAAIASGDSDQPEVENQLNTNKVIKMRKESQESLNGQINSNSIEDGKVRAIAPIGLLANSHQSKKNVPGENNNKDIMNVSSSINSRIGDPEYVKHSRTIHNNINYGSSSSIVVLWMIPGLIFLFITAYFLFVETRELRKLSHVSVEISLIDNAGYYMWVALLHPHYINMKRIAVEGIVGSSDFSKWGFEDLNSNVSSVMGNPSFQNQLLMTENLVDINQANSSYTSMYNRRLTSSKVYDMKRL